jgi:hypothetical protein
MANFVGLQDLVHAIAGAVTDAQHEVEKAQLANLAAYLDREHRPVNLQLRVPSIRPEAAPGDEDLYQTPLLALVPYSMLRIKQVEVSFDIELGELSEPTAVTTKSAAAVPGRPVAADVIPVQVKQSLNVNPAVSAAVKKQGTTAHVVLMIEAVERPDGLSRLMQEITKVQGVTGPAAKETKT